MDDAAQQHLRGRLSAAYESFGWEEVADYALAWAVEHERMHEPASATTS